MSWRIAGFCALSVSISVGCQAPSIAPGEQVSRTFSSRVVRTVGYDYLLYLPQDYTADSGKRWPLVLFLHGAGERGSDVNMVKLHGPPKLVAEGRKFPFILVSPQCPAKTRWNPDALNALLDEIVSQYSVDPDRVYLTGLSMGGYGTWDLASAYPNRFAAIAPICGGGAPWVARTELAKMPAWVFHGDQDQTVPIVFAEKMVEALRKVNAPVRFTVYPGVGHDSWTETYNNPEFYDWLLAQKCVPFAVPPG